MAAADGGSLFLDEVSDLPAPVQSKLLRALQEREYTPVGSTESRNFECRIISASSTRIQDAVLKGEFRPDLMYRLDVIPLDLPPLRERIGDITLLFSHFSSDHQLGPGVVNVLENYSWPGNVRELENTARYAVTFAEGSDILLEHLPARITNPNAKKLNNEACVEQNLSTHSRFQGKPTSENILEALRQSNSNRSAAARILGISRMSLYRYLKSYDLNVVSH